MEKESRLPHADNGQRPADLLLRHWDGGRHLAIDLTIVHGWQVSERPSPTTPPSVSRERWRRFLALKEAAKHTRYDALCAREEWSFAAMAFGTWGGMGPECAKMLHRIVKRSASWLEGDLRASRQEEIRHTLGLTLMRHIWEMLAAKFVL